jgi:hypothetical protein
MRPLLSLSQQAHLASRKPHEDLVKEKLDRAGALRSTIRQIEQLRLASLRHARRRRFELRRPIREGPRLGLSLRTLAAVERLSVVEVLACSTSRAVMAAAARCR